MAETAADMPRSYQIFKNDAQECPDKTARHRLAADLLPEIWVPADNLPRTQGGETWLPWPKRNRLTRGLVVAADGVTLGYVTPLRWKVI